MTLGQTLFYGGIALTALSTIAAIIASILLGTAGKRIQKTLDSEYGKHR
jgi:hypothetical protein